jgi:hypothetical protein
MKLDCVRVVLFAKSCSINVNNIGSQLKTVASKRTREWGEEESNHEARLT